MFNPIDERSVKAMVEYRHQELVSESCTTDEESRSDHRTRVTGLVPAIRWTLGVGLIRVGARIAGPRFQRGMGFQV